MYASFIEELAALGLGGTSEPVAADDVAALRSRYPGIPEDFLAYLAEVGAGDAIGWMVYGSLLTPDEIFDDETASEIGNVLFVADDFAGTHVGYRPDDDWALIKLDHAGLDEWPVYGGFLEFVREIVRLESAATTTRTRG